jgi:photosystem II stability/assembly factor-like uncharacterized protein
MSVFRTGKRPFSPPRPRVEKIRVPLPSADSDTLLRFVGGVAVNIARWSVNLSALAVVALCAGATLFAQQSAQTVDPSWYAGMRWRLLGPYRAGRVTAVAGIPGDPAIYYMGTPGGGVWKTTDGGDVWKPIFDEQRVASIGAVALAPSNPNIIYVGTGEQTRGNGVYKSTDAGGTWVHLGLEKTNYISAIFVDPRNPDIVIVGALGHPVIGVVTEAAERGIFKSVDGGKTWKHTLMKEELAGIADLCADPENPREIFATMWKPHDRFSGLEEETKDKPKQDGWIYKSMDEGSTWNVVGGKGLAPEPLDRMGVAVAAGTHGRRVFAISGQGLFRTDDAGETWRKITSDPRIVGNGYISRVYVDPRNADTVHVMQTTTYRSTDGGQTFRAFKGAPGGDDYHVMWIDPQNTKRMILGVDQGATISLDGGATWSSWYNQATGQFYHVITDNQFPYVAYAPQQDSGTVAVPSRSDYGEISYRDWFSIGGFEFGFIAPDPLHANIVYSTGWYGSVVRFDKTTGQIAHVFVHNHDERTAQMPPLVFSPHNPRTLYLGTQYAMKTTNNGDTWQRISPDLTVRSGEAAKPSGGSAGGHVLEEEGLGYASDEDEKDRALEQNPRRSMALTALSPSPIASEMLWAGTGNGIIQVTRDGGITWQNVSPPDLQKESMVSVIEPSHFDANEAYVTAATRRDAAPYVYRTRDGGKSWQKITDGLEPGRVARVVREDPSRRGLLYAGTEDAVYASFDDGEHWQSLELNLPTADMRDLVVHGNDLVAATYGRALWVLDDISPLRQANAQIAGAKAHLLRPASALRVRWDNDQETPLPAEIPAGQNPPDGAVLYYFLKDPPASPVTLEIQDASGKLVRRFSSDAPPADQTIKNVPDYWFPPLAGIPKNAGLNRFVWDLHYDKPLTLQYSYYGNTLEYVEYTISGHAVVGDTPREQTLGPLAVPGEYKVVLTVGGEKFLQPLEITLDPRVPVSQAELEQQFKTVMTIEAGLRSSYYAFGEVHALHQGITESQKKLEGNAQAKAASEALTAFEKQIEAVESGSPVSPGIGPINRDLARMAFMVESGDAAPSSTAREAIAEACEGLTKHLAEWRDLEKQSLPAMNATLEKYQVAALPLADPAAPKVPADTNDACRP